MTRDSRNYVVKPDTAGGHSDHRRRHTPSWARRGAQRPYTQGTFPNTGPQRRPVLDEFTEFRRDAVEALV